MKLFRSSTRTPSATARHAATSVASWWRTVPTPARGAMIAGIMIVTAVVLWVGFILTDTTQEPAPRRASNTPDYQTVLPSGTTIEALGGWRQLTPPSGEPFYVYLDTINGVDIRVSQQLLPRDFMENTRQQVSDFAQGFGATSEITINGGDTLYIGTSARGPQSAVLIKNGLLVLIKSQQTIDDAAWKRYAESLK